MGYARTNAPVNWGGSGGGSGGVTTVDLPTHPESISAASNNQKVIISLTYSDTKYISGVEVRYKTGSYPTSPTDGSGVTAVGAAESITISGLTNTTKYYFRVYLYREIDGVRYYQTDDTNATVSATPAAVGIDGIIPTVVTDSYLIIDTSGTFTLTVPESITATAYLVGGGCQGEDGVGNENKGANNDGGSGGYGASTLTQAISSGTHSCTATIGNAATTYNSPTKTTLKINTSSYTTASTGIGLSSAGGGRDNLQVPDYGYIGSSGGSGGYSNHTVLFNFKKGGSGAGDGGNGGSFNTPQGYDGKKASNYGCGGGGGGGSYSLPSGGKGGAGKQGCIIIAWE